MTRVVFDTNVLYSAILKGASVPAKAIDLVAAGIVIPCLSDDVLAEYRRVLFRPELDLHASRRRELLAAFLSLSLYVAPAEKLTLSDHEPDNRFLECAEAALASYLVTGNVRHFPKSYESIRIVTPRQFLQHLITEQE